MHGATLIDKAGRPLRPCILWNDGRSAKEAAELDADPRFRKITGNIVFPGFTAPKLVWVHRHEPKIFGKVAQGAAAEGLCAAVAHGRLRLRHVGFRRHVLARRREARLVRRRFSPRRISTATRCRRSSKAPKPTGKLRAVLATRWGMTTGAGRRRRRRRQRRFRLRRGNGRARRSLRVARHVRRALRLQRKIPAECGERRPRLLPCAAEHLAPDGRDPVGRRVARMAGAA